MVLSNNHVDEVDAEQAVATLIHYITGRDPTNPGHELEETPARVIRAYKELFAGYHTPPSEILKWFPQSFDGPIIFREVLFWSTCEHHLLPFTGHVDLGYWANGEILGASKATRLVDLFARRLQTQENMTRQIVEMLWEDGRKHGVEAVVCRTQARHECMSSRGVNKPAIMEIEYAAGEHSFCDGLWERMKQ